MVVNIARFGVLSSFLAILMSFNALAATDISFNNAWIRLMPPTSMYSAGYVTIKNNSTLDDELLSVSGSVAESISIHQTIEKDGMMKMLSAENILIPSQQNITLAPGGMHIMFMGLNEPLEEGQSVTLLFTFKNAGEQSANFIVKRG